MLAEGRERYVALDAVAPGDLVLVKTGERVTVDGAVVDGHSKIDESLVTGEATPVARSIGDRVVAASVNVGGPLTVRASRTGSATTVVQMVASVERAILSRSSLERTADRVSRIFVPAVIAAAAATLTVTWATGTVSPGDAMMRAIAVLVIACPCALGIATPPAMTAAVGAASRRGILITDARVLETIRRLDVVVFDKTGTVTTGDFTLLDPPPPDDLEALAAVEARSEHLLARAVVSAARTAGLTVVGASDVDVLKGRGIRGVAGRRTVTIGNRRLVGDVGPDVEQRAKQAESAGRTVAFYRIGRGPAKPLCFGDRLKPNARQTVAALDAQGTRVILLSGDSRITTEAIGRELAVDEVRADATPTDKVQVIASLHAEGKIVAMLGDGANDGPALAQANLGVAIGSGTDLAIKAASMILMHDDVEALPEAFALARRAVRVIRQNLFWAFPYNAAGIAVAAAGLLHPIVAAGAMIVSSLTVIGNSARLGIGGAGQAFQPDDKNRSSIGSSFRLPRAAER